MIQVAESHVRELLDELHVDACSERDTGKRTIRFDHARGAVHFALRMGLISPAEWSGRCDMLLRETWPAGVAR